METAEPQQPLDAADRIDDIDRFRTRVSSSLSPFTLRSLSADPFTSTLWGGQLDRLEMVRFRTGSDLQVEIPEHLGYFDFIVALSGRAVVRTGSETVGVEPRRSGVVLQPGTHVEMALQSGYDQAHLRIAPAMFLTTAESLLGHDPGGAIRFDTARFDLAAGVSAWVGTLTGLIEDGVRSSRGATHPLMAGRWAEAVVAGILTSVPNTLAPLLDGRVHRLPFRSLQVATDFIESHLEDSLTVADIAAAAGVSVRALQRGFREHHGATPFGYVQQRRLAVTRRDLLNAGESETVADIAYRWGFTHLSRFAAAYRARYGETPSATLRRSRGGAPDDTTP